jgi:outer membrane protein OmpA-like peptidoglycan-associated protein
MVLISLFLVPSLFAQYGTTGTTSASNGASTTVAPTWSGETGLFTTVTGNTLRRGDVSFSVYAQNWRLLAGPAREFHAVSRRPYMDYGYDLDRVSASIGYGLSDRWEVSAMFPYDRIRGKGGDRAGFVNGWLYQGKFSDSGFGNVHLATKFGLLPPTSASKFAVSLFTDLGTGDSEGGIASGNTNVGFGGHWTRGIASLSGAYVITGKRNASDTNVSPLFGTSDVELPNELRLDGGVEIPIRFWSTTHWINELNATFYNGGDVKPKAPVHLATGIRHWFGNSGWALNAGLRWNVAKFGYDNDECRFTELADCGLAGLVGLTFAPMHLAAAMPAPAAVSLPAPCPPVVAPAPAPIPPPEAPVAPPRVPSELRTDEIHFEPGSARLTNIAKAILDDVAVRMKQEPTSTAIVIGYTDNREATGANQDLDRRRAEAVRDYLVSRHGIDASRITVEGRNGREPVGDNNTAEGRLKNRRVVIRLMLP